MDALRAIYESLGLESPRTILQTGNVVFRTTERNLPRLAARIEDAIEREAGFRPRVILRTTGELREAMAGNPFAERSGIEPAKLLLTFLDGGTTPQACGKAQAICAGPEELHIRGRHLYTYYPNGMGRSKLQPGALDKALGIPGTGRNWNTVAKLLEAAEALEAESR
jgi:uncharacterized protein (DUF1697 family)